MSVFIADRDVKASIPGEEIGTAKVVTRRHLRLIQSQQKQCDIGRAANRTIMTPAPRENNPWKCDSFREAYVIQRSNNPEIILPETVTTWANPTRGRSETGCFERIY
jgi:hypothetical protein